MSFFTDEEIRDANINFRLHSRDGGYYGTIGGIKGKFDRDYNLIDGEEYETPYSFHATADDIAWEESQRQAREVEAELYEMLHGDRYTPDGPYKEEKVGLLAGLLVLPFVLIGGAFDLAKIIRKAVKDTKEQEALNNEATEMPLQTEENKNVVPWYKRRINTQIRLHKDVGEDFNDLCIYQHGLRNGLGITNFSSGCIRIGFFEDGCPKGQSIRFGTDGSRLIGIDTNDWIIDGEYLRIFEKDGVFYSAIEIYELGHLVDARSPNKKEELIKCQLDNSVAYRSEEFAYQESYLDDGSILYFFLNKVGLRLSIKVYPNGDKAISRWNNGVQYGYCIVEPKNESPFVRYMDNFIALKTIKLDEKDDGRVDTPWYLKRIDYGVRFHKHEGIGFFDYSIYQKGLRDGLGVIYFKGDIKRTGFFKDGFLCGQSIREYPDGSRLIGIDQKGWTITGRYLRIDKDFATFIEFYENGKLIKRENPNEKERMYYVKKENGTYYYSEAFNYGEFVYLDGTSTKAFLNNKGLKLVIRNFADGRIVSSQFMDNVQKGYSIIEIKDDSPICRLMDDSNILKTLQLEEKDNL